MMPGTFVQGLVKASIYTPYVGQRYVLTRVGIAGCEVVRDCKSFIRVHADREQLID